MFCQVDHTGFGIILTLYLKDVLHIQLNKGKTFPFSLRRTKEMNTKKIIIAIETTPKGEDVDVGFMVSPKCRTIEEKLKGLRRSVDNGSYLKWSGKNMSEL